jgi:hypothetical protein
MLSLFVGLIALTIGGQAAPRASVADLQWMVGCWAGTSGDDDTRELWLPAGRDALIGVGRTVRGGLLRRHEFMVIRDTVAGVAFIARPAGQPEASFLLATLKDREAVFSNPQHDFPQRVSYRLLADGTLHARIEGTQNGNARGVDFPMRPVACP